MKSRGYVFSIIIAASVAGAGLWIDHALKEAKTNEIQSKKEQKKKDTNAILAAKQLNEQWKNSFDKTGKYPDRQNPVFHSTMLKVLAEIYRRDPRVLEAKELRDEYFARQAKIDAHEKLTREQFIENDASGRKQFAQNLEFTFLKNGKDLSAQVTGPKNSVLQLQYVLFNRPAIYQLQNETQFFQNAWAAGFKKVIIRNGFDMWTFAKQ